MIVKTNRLTGENLDQAVSFAVEILGKPFPITPLRVQKFSTDWALGGPIIEKEKICIEHMRGAGDAGMDVWEATMTFPDKKFGGLAFSEEQGSTALEAAMRAFAVSRLGNEVELPDEFVGAENA